jgi:pimeloyl-ACP methyl ester carboxylesterase
MANELYSLLQKSGHEGPYVLVGHSMGGANVRWFFRAHPREIVGMVLLDPATEDWPKHVLPRVPADAVPEFWRNLRAWEGIDPELFIAGYAELRNSESLGDRPLLILTAGKPKEDLASRREMHGKLKRLSTNSAHIIVERSFHNIQLDAPAAVIPSVRAVVHAARTGSRLSEDFLQKGL